MKFICRVQRKSSKQNQYVVSVNSENIIDFFVPANKAERVLEFQDSNIQLGGYYIVWNADYFKETKECIAKEYTLIPKDLYIQQAENKVPIQRTRSNTQFNQEDIFNDKLYPKDIAPLYN